MGWSESKMKTVNDSTTVLIVEDDQLFREMLCEIIHVLQPHWCVIEADNGQEGLQLAQAQRPDVIILDFNMPLMNGYQMVMALQQKPETRSIALILSTSEDDSHPLIVRLRTLCQATLFKPYSLRQLEQVLEAVKPMRARLEMTPYYHRGTAQLELV